MALDEADATENVNVALVGLREGLIAVAAFELALTAVRFLMLNDVAELGGANGAVQTREELVGTAGLRVDHKLLLEAQVLGVVAEAVSDTLLDRFLGQFG